MATKVNKGEEVEFEDGTKVYVRPLNIKSLREFMKVIQAMQKLAEESANGGEEFDEMRSFDFMVEAAQIALRSATDKAADLEYLEENLTLQSLGDILYIAGGVDMTGERSPNPMVTGSIGTT
jgi:hypothetical protein